MGKISKPQKSSKHKKIKSIDPFYVGNRSQDRHEDKYNQAPKRFDDWDGSRSLQEVIRLKNEAKNSLVKKQRKSKNKFRLRDAEGILDNLADDERGVTKPAPQVPEFKQRRGETEQKFLWRVDREARAAINKAHFEDKFHLGEDPSQFKGNSGKKKKGHIKKTNSEEDVLRTKTKRKERLMEKKQKIQERKRSKAEDRSGGFLALRDEVKFGDVVHQPPTLTVKPRKATDFSDASKIGSKKLLLHSLLESPADDETKSTKVNKKKEIREVGKTIKRKNLSPAEQRLMDNEREKAIESYRKLKQIQYVQSTF